MYRLLIRAVSSLLRPSGNLPIVLQSEISLRYYLSDCVKHCMGYGKIKFVELITARKLDLRLKGLNGVQRLSMTGYSSRRVTDNSSVSVCHP